MKDCTFVFRSHLGEIQITVIACDHARAMGELVQRLTQLEQMGIVLSTDGFDLVKTY